MRTFTKTMAVLGMVSTFAVTAPLAATAAPTLDPTVVSTAGIAAPQLAPAGSSAADVAQVIEENEAQVTSAAATQFYCEEGAMGLMDWTNNEPRFCYGNFYEYRDGQQIAKVNMIQLKAADPGLSGEQEARLKDWCDNNGTYCSIVFLFIPGVGKYLKSLL